MPVLMGSWSVAAAEADSGVKAWPYYLALAAWLAVVLVHGLLQARKEGRPDAG